METTMSPKQEGTSGREGGSAERSGMHRDSGPDHKSGTHAHGRKDSGHEPRNTSEQADGAPEQDRLIEQPDEGESTNPHDLASWDAQPAGLMHREAASGHDSEHEKASNDDADDMENEGGTDYQTRKGKWSTAKRHR
jgi:hypothetical protein